MSKFAQSLRSKIIYKIGILAVIEIIFIIGSFGILAYFQSQGTFLGNSINIAGKNRFLTANILFEASEYLTSSSSSSSSSSPSPAPSTSQLSIAMDRLESNIIALKEGGKVSGIDLKPLSPEFTDSWKTVNDKWHVYKTFIADNIIKSAQQQGQQQQKTITTQKTYQSVKEELKSMATSLINSSDTLVTQLADGAKMNAQNLMVLEIIFAIMNIGVILIILFLVIKILRPITALTHATDEIKKGNLDVSINHKGNDELRILSESFNSMVDSIRNHIKKQSELTDELKNVNEQLKHKDRLKDEFINIAAHELRNPIQPIIGLSEVMRSRNVNNDRRDDELLSVIIRNAKRLQRLSGDLLDVTKIESKSLILKKERFNLNNLISDAIEDCKNQIEKDDKQYDNVKLSYTPIQNIFVEADRGRITQVISNLINNAIKFTKKGTITVNADKRANKEVVVISVKDTGTGIDPQIFPQLFTKFATKSAGGSGIGLGLFISKSIVEAHGGRIWAANNDNNNDNNYNHNEGNNDHNSKNAKESKEGATFAFSLPTVE